MNASGSIAAQRICATSDGMASSVSANSHSAGLIAGPLHVVCNKRITSLEIEWASLASVCSIRTQSATGNREHPASRRPGRRPANIRAWNGRTKDETGWARDHFFLSRRVARTAPDVRMPCCSAMTPRGERETRIPAGFAEHRRRGAKNPSHWTANMLEWPRSRHRPGPGVGRSPART